MKFIYKIYILIILILLETLAKPTQAIADTKPEWKFSTGVGVVATEQIWLDSDNLVSPFPLLNISYDKWTLFGEDLVNYQLYQSPNYAISAGLSYRDDGFGSSSITTESESDNQVFDGYQTPDGDLTFSLSFGWHSLYLGVEQDISNTSKGTTAEVGLELPLYESGEGFSITSNIAIRWQSKNYTMHIFGLTGNQVDAEKGRTEFITNSATHYALSLNASYNLGNNWSIIGGAEYVDWDDDLYASPLIGRKTTTSLFIGSIYSF